MRREDKKGGETTRSSLKFSFLTNKSGDFRGVQVVADIRNIGIARKDGLGGGAEGG